MNSRVVPIALCAIMCAICNRAIAETPSISNTAQPPKKHAAYLGVLGKGGQYTVGYQFRWEKWFALGVAGSHFRIDFETLTTVNPYVLVYPYVAGNHALFVDLGPVFFRHHTKSPVPLLEDKTSFRIGTEISAGYEYNKGRFFVRPYLMVLGSVSVSLWGGVDLGVRWD